MEETKVAQLLKIFLVLITLYLSSNLLLGMEDDLDTNQPLLEKKEILIDITDERESLPKPGKRYPKPIVHGASRFNQ